MLCNLNLRPLPPSPPSTGSGASWIPSRSHKLTKVFFPPASRLRPGPPQHAQHARHSSNPAQPDISTALRFDDSTALRPARTRLAASAERGGREAHERLKHASHVVLLSDRQGVSQRDWGRLSPWREWLRRGRLSKAAQLPQLCTEVGGEVGGEGGGEGVGEGGGEGGGERGVWRSQESKQEA